MARTGEPSPAVMTPGEVARVFGVTPKTVTRWADRGLVASIRTAGGHRRLLTSSVDAMADSAPGRNVVAKLAAAIRASS